MDIVYYGDPVLRRQASPIERIDEPTRALAEAMVRTLTLHKGYGLAAPQVGVSKRLIVIDVEDFFEIVVNPEIVELSQETVLGQEGCLSLPGAEAQVSRHGSIKLTGQSLNGDVCEIQAEGLLARVFQHEVDHLNGVLFIDHLGEAKRLQVLKEFEKHRRLQGAES